jgi:hypothetical protein
MDIRTASAYRLAWIHLALNAVEGAPFTWKLDLDIGYWILDIDPSPFCRPPSSVACLLTTYVSEIRRRRVHLSRTAPPVSSQLMLLCEVVRYEARATFQLSR